MLNLIERRREIVRLTESKEKVDVDELAEQFGVSTVTIRNDLNGLSAKGLIVRSARWSRGKHPPDSRAFGSGEIQRAPVRKATTGTGCGGLDWVR